MGPKLGRPTLKQSTLDWRAMDKYMELKTFRLELNNILYTCNIKQGLQLIKTLMQAEQDRCNTMKGLVDIFNNKFYPQHNETIKSLQYCTLIRQSSENVKEWMGRLQIVAAECNYKAIDR